MKTKSFLIVLAIWLMVVPNVVFGVSINYPDFSDLSAFTLNTRAQELNSGDGTLHLIDGIYQRGTAFLTDTIILGETYSTAFSFQITDNVRLGDSDGLGADWLRFSIQTVEDLAVGGDMVGIEFDIYNNRERDNFSGNHIGLNVEYPVSSSVAIQHVDTRFNNDEVWFAWIDYDGSFMNIYASMGVVKPDTPYISHEIDVADILGTSEVYLGFLAASGAGGATFDVLDWSFQTTPVPEPATMLLLGTGLIGLVGFRKRSKRS